MFAFSIMLGAHDVHKSKPEGLLAQLRALRARTGWPKAENPTPAELANIAFQNAHDNLYACLSAWVASLTAEEREPFGSPPDDVIWVPRD